MVGGNVCGSGAAAHSSPPYFIRWKNMDRDHGAQSQLRSPLAKKRARIVITPPRRRHGTSELEQASRHTAAAAQTQETIRNNGRSVPQNLAPWNTCCAARYPGTVLVRLNGSPTNLEVKGLSTSSVGENQPNLPTFQLAYLYLASSHQANFGVVMRAATAARRYGGSMQRAATA